VAIKHGVKTGKKGNFTMGRKKKQVGLRPLGTATLRAPGKKKAAKGGRTEKIRRKEKSLLADQKTPPFWGAGLKNFSSRGRGGFARGQERAWGTKEDLNLRISSAKEKSTPERGKKELARKERELRKGSAGTGETRGGVAESKKGNTS